jgi:hypothetical protein
MRPSYRCRPALHEARKLRSVFAPCCKYNRSYRVPPAIGGTIATAEPVTPGAECVLSQILPPEGDDPSNAFLPASTRLSRLIDGL